MQCTACFLLTYLRECEKAVGLEHLHSVPVHVGTACLCQAAQVVQTGHVEDQTYILCVKQRAQVVTGGGFQRLETVAVRQAQKVEERFLFGFAQVGSACVQIAQEHGERFRSSVLQTDLGLRLRLPHPTVQQSSDIGEAEDTNKDTMRRLSRLTGLCSQLHSSLTSRNVTGV